MQTSHSQAIQSHDMVEGESTKLLIFTLGQGAQKFGVEIDQVREVVHCPKLARIPHSGSNVLGVGSIRGETVPVIDLATSVYVAGGFTIEDLEAAQAPLVIVCERDGRAQAMVIASVDNIIDCPKAKISTPPADLPQGHYLTAITELDGDIVSVLDTARVMSEANVAMPSGIEQAA